MLLGTRSTSHISDATPKAEWFVVATLCLCFCTPFCSSSRESASHLLDHVVTATLVENTYAVAAVYIDAARNILYFGAGGNSVTPGAYIGRVVLGSDCGTAPLVAEVVAGVKDQIGLQDGVGSGALFLFTHSIDGTSDGKTLFLSDYLNHVIRKISISVAGGGAGAVFNVTTIAGSTAGLADGVGKEAQLIPMGIALNHAETALYIGDYGNSAIRRINLSTLMVETLVKNSVATPISGLSYLRLTPDDRFVIFTDSDNHRIAKVSSAMGSATTITNIAGALGQSGVLDGVDGSSARFSTPRGLALSPDGSLLFVSSLYGNVLQAIRMDGTNSAITIAGNGSIGYTEANGSGRDFMLDPVATFYEMKGIALWQLSTQPGVTTAPAWAVITAENGNNVIRCVSGPGVSSPFAPPGASTAGTIRTVVSGSTGPSPDAYIHPVSGSLFTSGGQGRTVVVRYDLDDRTGAFIEPAVVVAGSTDGYVDGAAASALFNSVFGFSGDGGHIVYVTEYTANYCVRSINITSLEVKTVAGNLINAVTDGVGTNASLQYPCGLAYHPLRQILYVGGQTANIRRIDLTTRNVTTILLDADVIWPIFVLLTPTYDALFISVYQSHTILVMDTATETLIRVVAGVSGAAGTSDGFGSNARFTNPEGIALVGVEYGWPCLYVHEESPAYIREIRLRDQYVRTIPFVGLPAGVDIESIIAYTNRTTREFGLLLMLDGSRILFMPIGVVPTLTPSASNEWTLSDTKWSSHFTVTFSASRTREESPTCSPSATNSLSVTNSSLESVSFASTTNVMSLSATTRSSTLTSTILSRSSWTPQLSKTLTGMLTPSVCHCSPNTVRLTLAAHVELCVACQEVEGIVDSIPILARNANNDSFVDGAVVAQLEAASIARASLLQFPRSPFLITMIVNGSSCWYATDVTVDGLNTSLAARNIAGDVSEFVSMVQLLVAPIDVAWLSSSGDLLFQKTSLTLNVTLRCSRAEGDVLDRFVLITIPCPALPRTFASEVSTGITALQWVSAVGGTGASGAMGRLTVVRSLELCSAGDGLSGLVTVDLSGCTEVAAEDSVGGLLGNVAIIVAASLLLLGASWLLAPANSKATLGGALIAGGQKTAAPSTLLPLATTLLPTTAGLSVVVLRDLADVTSPTAGCQISVTVLSTILALSFCATTVAVSFEAHWVASQLEVVKIDKRLRDMNQRNCRIVHVPWLTKRYRWARAPGLSNNEDAVHRHFAVLLNEYRLLWYCVMDLLVLLAVGALAGIAQSLQDLAVCAGCGVVTCCVFLTQFCVCVRSRPFMSTFGNVYAALTLLLSTTSVGLHVAQLIVQTASLTVDVETLQRLMLGSVVCDLCVMGISSLRLLLDLHGLVTAVMRKVIEKSSHVNDAYVIDPLQKLDDKTESCANSGVGAQEEDMNVELLFRDLDHCATSTDAAAAPDNLSLMLPTGGDDVREDDLDYDILGPFWDDEGNAVQQGDAMHADSATDLMQVEVRNNY